MSFLVIVGAIASILFLLSYVTKRRFGIIGLALAAGSLLGQMWSQEATHFVSGAGVQLVAPPLQSVVTAVLILAPAIIVLRSGPVYHSGAIRIAASILFALMGVSFLLKTLAAALIIDGAGQALYSSLSRYNTTIITIGLIGAIIDIFLTKTHKAPRASSKH